jgi:NADH-quinone oxidoreductase subunit N
MNLMDLDINFVAIAPALILAITALLVLAVDSFSKPDAPTPFGYLSIFGIAVAGITAMLLSGRALTGFSGMISHDALAAFGEVIICAAAIITLLSAERDLARHHMKKGEYYILMLASLSGMAFMMSATDLVMLFLGLELMSIPVYALAGFNRSSVRSGESSLKYFILGAFGSAVLLYGSALIYGAVGSTQYSAIAEAVAGGALSNNLYMMLGTALLLAAMAFKVSAVPFHMWTPDVYEGAPTSITGFMGAAVKATAFIALARILISVFGTASDLLYPVLWVLAAASMLVGNVLALVQTNIKRMLAYSSVAHAGYLLIALAAGSGEALSSMLFYLFVYALANLGAFAVIIAISEREDAEDIESWAGLATRRPGMAAAMGLFMISLAGIPPTAGFLGKFYLFKEAIDRGLVNLVIIGVVASVIGVFYYLKVVVYMYMKEGPAVAHNRAHSIPVTIGLGLVSLAVVLFGVLPDRLLEIARNSVVGLF